MNVELRRVHRSKNKRNLKLLSFLFNHANTPAFLSTYYNKHVEEIKKVLSSLVCTPCLKKAKLFCYNYAKLPPNLTIFGTKMANCLKL